MHASHHLLELIFFLTSSFWFITWYVGLFVVMLEIYHAGPVTLTLLVQNELYDCVNMSR
jgi:hypothetical protein